MCSGPLRAYLFLLVPHCVLCIATEWKGGTKWATAAQEAVDEIHDADLLRAVQQSVAEWERKRLSHRHKRAESSVCYDGVGCFQDSGPYGYIDMLPSPPDEVNTRFLLYNSRRNRRGDTPLLDVAFTNITAVFHWADQAFNSSAPTKVIVHGFGSSCSHVWVYEMRSALMSVESCNVICVDWEGGATFPNYVRAAANARLVGKQVAMLISGLNEKLGLPLQNVHLIGFSLGAHVAGFAGAELKNLSRITGLDPAGPLFESQDPRARLDSSDAAFVDVIHSNGENLILGGLGSWQPMGHVDFYPNGGRMQKGCSNLFVGAVTDIFLSVPEVEGRSLCNHRRAYKFFTDSVSPRCQFPAVPCESFDRYAAGQCFPCPEGSLCGNMGYYANKAKGRGTQFLVTREEEPFCAHQYLVRLDSTTSVLPVTSYGKIQLTLVSNAHLNETFTLTVKDDEELKVGSSLSKIIVPHPALQEFTKVQVLYTAYSGWISSGLASWSIDKITLIDTFGKSLSICRKGLVLESGIAVHLPLYPGDCNIPDKKANDAEAVNKSNVTSVPSSLILNNQGLSDLKNNTGTKYIPTQVIRIGDEIISRNLTGSKDFYKQKEDIKSLYLNTQWQPLVDFPEATGGSGNGLEQATAYSEDSGRSFLVVREVGKENITYNSSTTKSDFKNQTLILGELVTINPFLQSDANISTSENSEIEFKMKLFGETLHKNISDISHVGDRPYEFVKFEEENDTSVNISLTERPEIKEPILPSTTPRLQVPLNRKNGGRWIPGSELKPPSMGATESWYHWESTTPSTRRMKNLNLDKNETERSFQLFTVQLFPQRLISFLEQAERYARMAFSPFTSTDPETKSRRLKFLPFFWSSDSDKEEDVDVSEKEEANPNPPGRTRRKDDTRVAIPYTKDRSNYHPKYIPLKAKTDDSKVTEKAEKNFNRPEMIVEHMEEPMIIETVGEKENVRQERNER